MRIAALVAATVLSVAAAAQDVHGELEYFYLGAPIKDRFRVIERTQRFSFSIAEDQFRVVFGYWWVGQFDVSELDEVYAEYEGHEWSLLAGRHFSRFGLTDWYEQWYSGFVRSPFIHTVPMTEDRLRFRSRYDVGALVSGQIGSVDLQAAILDVSTNSWQVGPGELDHWFLRGQTMIGSGILGASILGDDDGALIGVDARWSIPNWQLRSEIMLDDLNGDDGTGMYIDVFHRPKGWTNATLLARWQSINHPHAGSGIQSMLTAGARFRINDFINVDMNYSDGPQSAQTDAQRGWSFQLRFSYRF